MHHIEFKDWFYKEVIKITEALILAPNIDVEQLHDFV